MPTPGPLPPPNHGTEAVLLGLSVGLGSPDVMEKSLAPPRPLRVGPHVIGSERGARSGALDLLPSGFTVPGGPIEQRDISGLAQSLPDQCVGITLVNGAAVG